MSRSQRLLLRSQRPQLSNYEADDDIFDDVNTDLHVGYNRPKIEHQLSPYIRTRLKMARLTALKKYSEVWG